MVVESFFIVARAGLLTLAISNALVRLFVLLGWCSMSTETLNMKGLLWQWAPRTKHGSRCTFEVRTQGLFDLFVFSISFEVGTRVLWCWLEDFLPATFGNGHVLDMVVRSLTTASVDLLRPQVANNSSYYYVLPRPRPTDRPTDRTGPDRTVSTFPFEENAGFAFRFRTPTILRESNVFF